MDIGEIKCFFGLHKWDGSKCTRFHCSKTRNQSDDIEEPHEHVRQEFEQAEREWVEWESKLKVELLEQLDLLPSVEGELERWQWPGRGKEPGLESEGQRQIELVQERERLRQERACLRENQERMSEMLNQLRMLKQEFREGPARELVAALERMPSEFKHERLQGELMRELVRLERQRLEREQ